ncbi:MAG: hypothetical protein K2V38_19345 [Gemmataceae bacterium]|nr:hypothetical protein [Gemmataceae bacterium]
MATADIDCPNCGKTLSVPDKYFGKKIKCKHCAHPLQVNPPGAKADKGTPKDEPKPAAPYKFQEPDDDDTAKPNPLGVIAESDVPRCPHCAKELDPPDAKVCIHCGFNNVTRTKAESKKVWAPDANDYINHLAPGVLALILFAVLVTIDVVFYLNMRSWMEGSFLESEQNDPTDPTRKAMLVRPGAFIILTWAITVMPLIGTARFAIKRLFIDNQPMERLKK